MEERRLSKTEGKTVKKNTGETGMKGKMMSSKAMEKQLLYFV